MELKSYLIYDTDSDVWLSADEKEWGRYEDAVTFNSLDLAQDILKRERANAIDPVVFALYR